MASEGFRVPAAHPAAALGAMLGEISVERA
jgi:hypothetical protein